MSSFQKLIHLSSSPGITVLELLSSGANNEATMGHRELLFKNIANRHKPFGADCGATLVKNFANQRSVEPVSWAFGTQPTNQPM